MNESILNAFDAFQIAELDDDMIGIGMTLINLMAEVCKLVDTDNLPPHEVPTKFYKLNPHLPRVDLRTSYRKMCAYAVKHQDEDDEEIKLINIYVAAMAGLYIYHMPAEKMIELASVGTVDREVAKQTLLDGDMSPNWIKEPSNIDFSAFML
jgi:hypothetical protein